ncbi:MAG: UDP-2,4-diacetamido-2,4,6-trideoxy-beta-L-altropyranose hydrolase [Piscinibacter sp.]|uniref:UDP-2,4-diacetamido-2,4, 6-trideoxy-beta-L-altropyranose hydrolase n=1 Tax=Piscinibacter sp. TaxID=1903157 RepID=UPI003D0DDCEC
MRIALRADASAEMGIGHVTRCLALAQALEGAGTESCLLSRSLGVDTQALARRAGVAHQSLAAPSGAGGSKRGSPRHADWAQVSWEQDAAQTAAALADWSPAWVVVDHYAFDACWHREVGARLRTRIAVVDDLGDRALDAALLIDQNLAVDFRAKYSGRWPADRPLLGGPRYALLRPEYAAAPKYSWREEVRSIGIFLGGADIAGLSARALEACRSVAGFRGPIEIVTTSANPELATLRQACADSPGTTLAVDLRDLSDFFARHDLQIGAGGGASWERCCIGVPTLTLVGAENQAVVVQSLVAGGITRTARSTTVEDIGDAVARLIEDAPDRRAMVERSRAQVDGRGALRVAAALLGAELRLRPAVESDACIAHKWRQDPRTRSRFRDSREVPWEAHTSWWKEALQDPLRRLLVACCGRLPVGILRFDLSASSAEISLYLDPELTGIGLGTRLLVEAKRWIAAEEPSLRRLTAHVMEGNSVSAAAFSSAGFTRVGALDWTWETSSAQR